MTDVQAPSARAPVGTTTCPRCAASIAPEQDWCLVCGAAARTRLARAPNWKLPVAVLVAIVAAAVVALALAFVALTDSPGPATGTTGPTGPGVVFPGLPPVGPTGPTGAALTG